MVRGSKRRIRQFKALLTRKYGSLDGETLEALTKLGESYSRTGELLQIAQTRLAVLRQEYEELSAYLETSKQDYNNLFTQHQELKKVMKG